MKINLATPVELPEKVPSVKHNQHLLLMGSCFAENIGNLLIDHFFHCDINPFGILYNPLSVSEALHEILIGKVYSREDLFYYGGYWHSPMHHGVFSSVSCENTLRMVNERLEQAHSRLGENDWLLLTWGTAFVYENKETGKVVSNCHKQPEKVFIRRRLEVEEVVDKYMVLFTALLRQNPSLKVLFTLSPIRHVRDGMHENQLSKAILLLAIDRLQAIYPNTVYYFPSYEIMLDELRDYRFYADDMLHPSPLAVKYIWERFSETFFLPETKKIMEECESIRKALKHRPFHPGSEEHKRFLGQIVLKIERLNGKYPYLDFQKERELCHTRLKI